MLLPDCLKNTFYEAAYIGDASKCKELIVIEAKANDAVREFDSKIHELVNKPCDPAPFDDTYYNPIYGARALHWAVVNDSVNVVNCLVEMGANLQTKTYNGEENLCSWAGRAETRLAGTARYMTSRMTGTKFSGKNYLICPSDPGSAGNVGTPNKDETPLHWAAKHNAVKSLSYLIEHGAQINEKTYQSERTPLHLAAGSNSVGSVKILLDAGADAVDNKTFYGTPLHYAAGNNAVECIDLLLKAGAEIDAKGLYGTPLFWAASNNSSDAVKKLLDNRASVKSRCTFREVTPLHWAAAMEASTCVSLLLDNGASIDAESFDGETPLQWAARYNSIKSVKFLVDAKADFNHRNKYGNSVLHSAAQGLAFDVVKYLFETTRVRINANNEDGAAPLDLAIDALNIRKHEKEQNATKKIKDGEKLIVYLKERGASAALNGKLPPMRAATRPPRLAAIMYVMCLLEGAPTKHKQVSHTISKKTFSNIEQ